MNKIGLSGKIGVIASIAYAVLIGWAYGSQIIKLHVTKDPSGVSLQFFLVGFIAVALRATALGSSITEVWRKAKTRSVSTISLAIAEVIVLLGLLTVLTQLLILR